MEIILDIKSALKSVAPQIFDILSRDFREELNQNVHILDLSYTTLLSSTYSRIKSALSSVELAAYNNAYELLVKVLLEKCAGRIVSSIDDPLFQKLAGLPGDKVKFRKGPTLIYQGTGEGMQVFLVGSQYKSLQKYFSENIAGAPRLKATRFGKFSSFKEKKDAKGRILKDEFERTERTRTDFGHIPTLGDENLTSPLVKKLEAVIASTSASVLQVSNAEKALEELYSVQIGISHRFKNTTNEVIEKSRSILGAGYIVVTLQNQKLNSKFSAAETRIYTKLIRSIVQNIDYGSIKGSNTVVQDLAQGLRNIIEGKGKKLLPHKASDAKENVNVKAKITSSTSKGRIGINSAVTKKVQESLANLPNLINGQLAEQVKKNMGRGNATGVLNLRTGRLAESAEVTRVSESRQGMITAFYTYMKNPYATFSQGGRQERPLTRDPRLLIAKSIREIGASLAYTKMRAVNV